MTLDQPHRAVGSRARRRPSRSLFGALLALALAAAPMGTARAATPSAHAPGTRVSAWSPSMTTGGPSFENQTLRMVVHSSVAGSRARITLSNRYSSGPLEVAAANVAVQVHGGEAKPGTARRITFGGSDRVTVPAATRPSVTSFRSRWRRGRTCSSASTCPARPACRPGTRTPSTRPTRPRATTQGTTARPGSSPPRPPGTSWRASMSCLRRRRAPSSRSATPSPTATTPRPAPTPGGPTCSAAASKPSRARSG